MSKEREIILKAANILSDFKEFEQFASTIYKILAQPEQEPVAWRTYRVVTDDWQYHIFPYGLDLTCQPLYLAPPKREPSASAREMYQRGYAKAELDLKREPLSDEERQELAYEHRLKSMMGG